MDKNLVDRIEKALSSGKLDFNLTIDFKSFLTKQTVGKFIAPYSVGLSSQVSYFAVGTPKTQPKNLNHLGNDKYVGKTTYLTLLDHVENPDFKHFEKSVKLQMH